MVKLENFFKSIFNKEPEYFAYAPGRTNVIGEHTDYNNCPVFPFAVGKKISAYFSLRDDNKIVIYDCVTEYGSREFLAEKNIEAYETGNWGNYPKAAVSGIINDNLDKSSFKGFDAVISSDLPAESGMSSSTAFVVLTGLMFCQANNIEYSKIDFAELMAKSERFVGTAGGGMDQAASIMGAHGKILKIDFSPLRCEYAEAPKGWKFVVANSLKKAPKTHSALLKYNSKSIECRLAAALLNKLLKGKFNKDFEIKFLADLNPSNCEMNEKKILKLALSVLKKGSYSYNEIASILGDSIENIQNRYCIMRDGKPFPEPENGFMLSKRVKHVLTEWKRVIDSFNALNSGNIKNLGKLMDESHLSCKNNHEITCEELDTLVKACKKAGAIGSRMTGAGFGGCTISLVKEDKVDKFVEKISKSYYENYFCKKNPEYKLPPQSDYIFIVYPEDGASCSKL